MIFQVSLDPALVDQCACAGRFTRDRHLTLPRIAAMMMSGMCASVQTELDTLFGQLKGMAVRSRGGQRPGLQQGAKGIFGGAVPARRPAPAGAGAGADRCGALAGLRVVAADASRLRVSTRANAKLSADHYAFALFLPGPS